MSAVILAVFNDYETAYHVRAVLERWLPHRSRRAHGPL